MNKAKYRVSIYSIILYIAAALFAVFAIWTTKVNYDYVKEMLDFGQIIVEGNEFNIISYIFSASGTYYALALGLVGIGIALQKITNVAVPVLRKLNGEQEEQTNYDYTPEFPYDPQAGYPVDEAFADGSIDEAVIEEAVVEKAEAAEETEYQIAADEAQDIEK